MHTFARKLALVCGLLGGLPLLHAALTAPRAWPADATPVAFWAWRAEAPTTAELAAVQETTGTKVIFLRAGQLDYHRGQVRRIRPVDGALPRGVALHLVYHATRDLLTAFEQIEPSRLAEAIAAACKTEVARAARDGAQVAGVQLDLDVPTRLLAPYADALRLLRPQLPPDTALSITGLPTWMGTDDLRDLLAQTDFWTPQFYGAVIPRRIEQTTPIAAPQPVAAGVAPARHLDHPFYAGLAAYGYAILYSAQGELLEVRGDVAPALLANRPELELRERRAFAGAEGEWRYVYEARSDLAVAGWQIKRGERVMIELPSSESLRATARAARAEGGDKLLGLCLFRLPMATDATNLTLPEVAAALADRDSVIDLSLSATTDADTGEVTLRAVNRGTTGAQLGPVAFRIELPLPPGTLRGVTTATGIDGKTHCETQTTTRRCSRARANALYLTTRAWQPGATAQARLAFASPLPDKITARVRLQTPDGRVWEKEEPLTLNTSAEERGRQ